MTPIERRVASTEALFKDWNGKALDWGARDCARLARASAIGLGWTIPLARVGTYGTASGARRAMQRNGWESVVDIVDGFGFPRMAYACRLPGDVFAVANDPEQDWRLGALYVVLGNGRALGFSGGVCQACQPTMRPGGILAAWRVDPI